MFTTWTADRWGYNPMAYELNGVTYVSPGTYEKLRGHISDNGSMCTVSLKIQVCSYLSDYRAVPEPCWRGWWFV